MGYGLEGDGAPEDSVVGGAESHGEAGVTDVVAVPDNHRVDFEVIVDYLFPELDAYEASLYVFLYRKSIHVGVTSLRVGKRSITASFVRGARGGGRGNRGGLSVNYAHLSRALKSLESKGCIRSGDTTREGTLYTLVNPTEIPFVAAKLAHRGKAGGVPEDFFSDPAKRREIFERDRWACRYCGELLSEATVTLDHYIPQSKGGNHFKDNLRTACLMCNSIKSGRTYEEVAPLLLEAVAERRSKSSLPKRV